MASMTHSSCRGQKILDEHLIPFLNGTGVTLSFAYQTKRGKNGNITSFESLFRGCAARTHAAPALLFPILASPQNRSVATKWKVLEIQGASQFSNFVDKPVSINFTKAELYEPDIINALQQDTVTGSTWKHMSIE